jgi:hypothetical protein
LPQCASGSGTAGANSKNALAADAGRENVSMCDSAAPISTTELQSRASGPSVFGRVIGGDAGLYDPYRMTGCGIPGARVCLADSTTCTESDAAGQFVLQNLPEQTPVEITVEKSGFRSALRLAMLGNSPVNLYETRLLTKASATSIFMNAGIEVGSNRAYAPRFGRTAICANIRKD